MTAELTPWFPADVTPVRPGVYQRGFPNGVWCYAEWTGAQWLIGQMTAKKAARSRKVSYLQGSFGWRGLAKDPAS